MKNLFKIVLPAFALMLAITASLAFTANEVASDESTTAVWIQKLPGVQCQSATVVIPTGCDPLNTGTICTVDLFGVGNDLEIFQVEGLIPSCVKPYRLDDNQ